MVKLDEYDEPDLSDAELLADSARGVTIPQFFAQTIRRDFVVNVNDDEWKILEVGPIHEHYWDIWADVLDNARLTNPDTDKTYYLYQTEGDLWLVPVEDDQ